MKRSEESFDCFFSFPRRVVTSAQVLCIDPEPETVAELTGGRGLGDGTVLPCTTLSRMRAILVPAACFRWQTPSARSSFSLQRGHIGKIAVLRIVPVLGEGCIRRRACLSVRIPANSCPKSVEFPVMDDFSFGVHHSSVGFL